MVELLSKLLLLGGLLFDFDLFCFISIAIGYILYFLFSLFHNICYFPHCHLHVSRFTIYVSYRNYEGFDRKMHYVPKSEN